MEKQIFGKQIYAGLGKDNGTERGIFNRQTLLGPSLSTYLVQTILSMVITLSSLPRIGPLSTFFEWLTHWLNIHWHNSIHWHTFWTECWAHPYLSHYWNTDVGNIPLESRLLWAEMIKAQKTLEPLPIALTA